MSWEIRNKVMTFKVTENEYKKIKEYANSKSLNNRNTSEFIRETVLIRINKKW